jgi:fused signal recognition particle receptor
MFESLKKRLNVFMSDASEKIHSSVSTTTKIKVAALGKSTLSASEVEDMVWRLQTGMLECDVSVDAADQICETLKERLSSLQVSAYDSKADIQKSIEEVFQDAMYSGPEFNLIESIRASSKPYTIIFLGVNGTGKTTTMCKIAKHIMDNGFSVVFAAGDTFRAGAIEQLKTHAERLGIKVIAHQRGADSAAVIYDAIEHARARGTDVVLADTAGRMQSKANLMEELKKIVRVNNPNAKIFIGDALAGNDALEQAKAFNEVVGFDAAILSKIDADAKGGAAISIIYSTKKPIIYVGVGQKYEDLQPFDKNWLIKKILE